MTTKKQPTAYRVTRDFRDLKDSEFIYRAGESYPRKGARTSKVRVDSLKAQGFIKEI